MWDTLSPEGEGRALGIVAQDSGEKCGLVLGNPPFFNWVSFAGSLWYGTR